MWPIAASACSSHSEVRTGWPDSAWNVGGADEALRVVGHRHAHVGAGVAQAAHQFGRLVGGDAAAHAEQDAAAGKRRSRRWQNPTGNAGDQLTRTAHVPRRRAPRAARQWWATDRRRPRMDTHAHPRLARRRTSRAKSCSRAARRALSDAELLAIFLGSGLRGQDAVATARELLAAHGPLRGLLERAPTAAGRAARPRPGARLHARGGAGARPARTSPPTWSAAKR